MAETEPKARKAAAPAALAHGGGDTASDGTEDKERAPKTVAGLLSGSSRLWHRWRSDVFGVGVYAAGMSFSCFYASGELMQPPDALGVRILGPLFYVLFALCNVAWLGMMYHGPGRPSAAADSQLHPQLTAMLAAGRFCRTRAFDATEGSCTKCSNWKPVLTYHCSTCGSCGLWMDHHLTLAAQCVGFRNTRCFIVWAVYCAALAVVCLLLSLHRLALAGLPDGGALEWVLLGAWACDVLGMLWLGKQLGERTVCRIMAGWPSSVLLSQFSSLVRSAKLVLRDLQDAEKRLEKTSPSDSETVMIAAVSKKLRSALDGLVRADGSRVQGTLKGPFTCKDTQEALQLAFGEPLSWRWLVPGVPGGTGDPIRPEKCNLEACAAWAALGSALEQANPTLARAKWLTDQWSRRVRQILGDGARAAADMEPP